MKKIIKNKVENYRGFTIKYNETYCNYRIYDPIYDNVLFMTSTRSAARSYIDIYISKQKKEEDETSEKKYWWQKGQYE